MYLGIDVGGTKTLLATFSAEGKIIKQSRLATNQDYSGFIDDLRLELACFVQPDVCCCALPTSINFETYIMARYGNLPWENTPVKVDLESLLPNTKVLIHNDAKLGGLSEGQFLKDKYKKILYITIGTGIGGAVIIDGRIAAGYENFEPGRAQFEHDGKLQKWEQLASGKALTAKYGKKASDIDDPAIWEAYSKLISLGLQPVLADVQPDVVIFGGGVGEYFERFQHFLADDISSKADPILKIPELTKARRPEEAVIYGCYEYIKQNL